MSSVMTTQVADWHEKARELMPITISPLQSIMGGAAHGGHVASRSGTSEGTERDRDRDSKIRARLSTENHLLSTTHAVGSRASQRREQQVSGKKAPHTTRPGPVCFTIKERLRQRLGLTPVGTLTSPWSVGEAGERGRPERPFR